MLDLPQHVGELPRLALILFGSGLAYRQAASLLRFAFERKSDLDTSARPPDGPASWGPTKQGTAVVDPPPEAPEIAGPQAPLAEVQTGGVELIDALAEEWRGLCEEEPNDQPFCRPEWVGAYLRAFAPRAKLVLITARVDGRLRAVLPLIEERGFLCGLPVRKLRSAANVHCVRFDMVRGAGAEGEAAVLAVWRRLRDLPGWDLIDLPYAYEGGTLEQLLQAARGDEYLVESVQSWRSVYVPLPGENGAPQNWFPGRKADFRAKLHRRRRKLQALGPLALRSFVRAHPEVLQRFYDLEASGWKGRRGTAIAQDPQRRQFYDEVAAAASRFGYLSLDSLELNSEVVSAHFGLRYRGRYFLPKAAYNEEFRGFGPGLLLVQAILLEHQARQLREFDFTGPWAPDEAQWANETRGCFEGYIFSRRGYGALLHAVRFKLRRAIKALMRLKQSKIPAPPQRISQRDPSSAAADEG